MLKWEEDTKTKQITPSASQNNIGEMKHRCQKKKSNYFFPEIDQSWSGTFSWVLVACIQQWAAPAFWWGPSSWPDESTLQRENTLGPTKAYQLKCLQVCCVCSFQKSGQMNSKGTALLGYCKWSYELVHLENFVLFSRLLPALGHSQRMTRRSIIHSLSKRWVCFSKDILYCHVGIQDIVRHVPQFLLT